MAVPGGDFVPRTAYPGHGQGEKYKNSVRGRIPQGDLCRKLFIYLHFNALILFWAVALLPAAVEVTRYPAGELFCFLKKRQDFS